VTEEADGDEVASPRAAWAFALLPRRLADGYTCGPAKTARVSSPKTKGRLDFNVTPFLLIV
jgi:hypothetical protein